jgi:hypothetical protein
VSMGLTLPIVGATASMLVIRSAGALRIYLGCLQIYHNLTSGRLGLHDVDHGQPVPTAQLSLHSITFELLVCTLHVAKSQLHLPTNIQPLVASGLLPPHQCPQTTLPLASSHFGPHGLPAASLVPILELLPLTAESFDDSCTALPLVLLFCTVALFSEGTGGLLGGFFCAGVLAVGLGTVFSAFRETPFGGCPATTFDG